MDFLNKLGMKAGEAFQTVKDSEVTQKAKNYAGIPGLSIQVGKQESIVKQAYEAIGESYFNLHKDDMESPYAEQIAIIKEAQEKIGELKAQIEEKKNGTSAACDAPATEVNVKICPDCQKEVLKDAMFCSGCGHKFEAEPEAEEVLEAPEKVTDAEIIPPEV